MKQCEENSVHLSALEKKEIWQKLLMVWPYHNCRRKSIMIIGIYKWRPFWHPKTYGI